MRKLKRSVIISILADYPVQDRHSSYRTNYVLYPIEIDGKWVCARVLLPTGYQHIDPEDPTYVRFDNEEIAQKACDMHNKWIMGSLKKAQVIIDESFANYVKL